MPYLEKRTNLFLKLIVFFKVWLCFPVYDSWVNWFSSKNDDETSTFVADEHHCTEKDCFFPSKDIGDKDVRINKLITWDSNKNLVLRTKGDILFEEGGRIIVNGNADIVLMAGMEPGIQAKYINMVKFTEVSQIELRGNGSVKIYYNPIAEESVSHKYQSSTPYVDMLPDVNLETYMLVNDVYDLQGITGCLYGSYALSQDIDASLTNKWNCDTGQCMGFYPIMEYKRNNVGAKKTPFFGTFDGNGYTISGLFINRPEERNVGLFGDVTGINRYNAVIMNFTLKDSNVTGKHCVGTVVGQATGVMLNNINVVNCEYHSLDVKRGEIDKTANLGAGCVLRNTHQNLTITKNTTVSSRDEDFFGSCVKCEKK